MSKNKDFSGNDVISISTMNKNGFENAHLPLIVEPINDPPVIHAPEYVLLEKLSGEYFQIVGNQDSIEFFIEDPDSLSFPDNNSEFMVTFSMEVSAGILQTVLPSGLVNVTEIKPQNSYHWQPLQNFVAIANCFVVRAKGIRFHGSLKQCNEAMKQLLYKGPAHGAVLSFTVNDMGNYGCYPDCSENISAPLFMEASVNLIKRRPMTSLVAHSLGSAIIIEFIVMIFIGAALLIFICKCAIALGKERTTLKARDFENFKVTDVDQSATSMASSDNATYVTGCSTSFLRRRSNSSFRKRSRYLLQREGSSREYFSAQLARDDYNLSSPNIEMADIKLDETLRHSS